MVRHRWTLALILIFVSLLVTVISAFRVRLPGGSHEVKFERKHKCEDCDVSDLNLDPVVRSSKKDFEKRSLYDIKKVLSDKRHLFDEKLSKKEDKWHDIEDIDSDVKGVDDTISKKAIFKHIKIDEPKSDLKSKSKKVSLVLDFNDNDEDDNDDDDSDIDDDDNVNLLKLPKDQKKEGVIDLNKKLDIKQEMREEYKKPSLKTKVVSKRTDDNIPSRIDEDHIVNRTKQRVNIPSIKTVVINSIKLKNETRHTIKSEILKETLKPKLESAQVSEIHELNDADISKVKTTSKAKDTLTKELRSPQLKLQNETAAKDNGSARKEKQVQIKSDNKEIKDSIKKNAEINFNDISKVNNKVQSRDTVNKPTKTEDGEIDISSKNDHKDLQYLSDVLQRRNLLQSEFEDFYAFFPTFAPNFSRVHNPECRRHGQIMLRQLRGTKLWALNMLDATAKIPSGLLQGNGIQLGDFDQCLGVRARVQLDTGSVVRIQGKYCLAMIDVKAEHPELETPVYLAQSRNLFKSKIDDPGHFVPRFSTLSWGVCVPSPCSPEDVEVVLRDTIKHYQYKTGISIRVKVDEHDCHTRKGVNWWKEWLDVPTILTLSAYATVIVLVMIATVQDFLAKNNSEVESSSTDQRNPKNTNKNGLSEKKTSNGFLRSFSLYNTLGKLVAPVSNDEIGCVHGVRAIVTVVLLVAHKILPIALTPYTNRLKITEFSSSPLLSWWRAGWIFTDCFLLLSGTLTSYRKSTDEVMASKLLSRYLRLTPAMMAVVFFYAYIWDNISSGPMWGTLVTKNAELCQQGWWWNLFYVQNYFGFEDMCAPQTHHMALDFQLTILGGIIVWALQSELPFSGSLMPLLHLLSAYSRYTTFRDHRLTLLVYQGVSVTQLYRTSRLSYMSAFHRCSPYLIGLSLGLSLRKSSTVPKILRFIGWIACVSLWGLILWAGADSGSFQYRYNVMFNALYATLAPIGASLGFTWIIYVVHKSENGILTRLLSSYPLLFISRISYALYLIQFVVYLTRTATTRTPKEFSLMVLIDIQEILILLIFSILLTITLVIPLQSIPKIGSGTRINELKDSNVDKQDLKENTKDNDTKIEKDQIIKEVPQRRSFMAHREVLEEIPEADVEYEMQRDSNETLEEILEEEDDGLEEEIQEREDEDLEIIEEEQGAEEEDFWTERQENLLRRSVSGDNERDMDEWEWTNNGSDQSRSHSYSR